MRKAAICGIQFVMLYGLFVETAEAQSPPSLAVSVELKRREGKVFADCWVVNRGGALIASSLAGGMDWNLTNGPFGGMDPENAQDLLRYNLLKPTPEWIRKRGDDSDVAITKYRYVLPEDITRDFLKAFELPPGSPAGWTREGEMEVLVNLSVLQSSSVSHEMEVLPVTYETKVHISKVWGNRLRLTYKEPTAPGKENGKNSVKELPEKTQGSGRGKEDRKEKGDITD